MFFDNLASMQKIAEKTGCVIFVVPDTEKVTFKKAIELAPKEKVTISIEQVREVIDSFSTKQLEPRFVVVRPAEKLSEAAQNAILKSLEEPEENVHYVLITEQPHRLLPTILSRAGVYIWRKGLGNFEEIKGNAKTKELARELLKARPGELVDFAEKMAKNKDGARQKVLEVLAVAIEMCYKTYFLTGKKAYVLKATKLVAAYDGIAMNGQLKIHLVADLL